MLAKAKATAKRAVGRHSLSVSKHSGGHELENIEEVRLNNLRG